MIVIDYRNGESKEEEYTMQEFYLKVAGVTYEGRQAIVRKMKEGDKLTLEPEPTNAYDDHAVKVITESGECIGFIPREHNRVIFENLVNGRGYYEVKVSAITGGGFGSAYGCNMHIYYY